MLLWTQLIRCSMYSGADILVGFLKLSESCQRYSNLRHIGQPPSLHLQTSKCQPYSSVAFISGHDCGEQNSVIDP